MEDIDVRKVGIKESKMRVELTVKNPNLFPFRMKDIRYDLKAGKKLAMEGRIDGIISIPAKSQRTLPIELEMKNGKMLGLLRKTIFDAADTKFRSGFSCGLISKNEFLKDSKLALRTHGHCKRVEASCKNY
jgi:LEA14-like dessication related protein